ncbi:MAG TPA: hypothetical protein VFQ39_04830 [Longimicrobium sp.]|nr:hypothetical protein [Longimicrobium sp.]
MYLQRKRSIWKELAVGIAASLLAGLLLAAGSCEGRGFRLKFEMEVAPPPASPAPAAPGGPPTATRSAGGPPETGRASADDGARAPPADHRSATPVLPSPPRG